MSGTFLGFDFGTKSIGVAVGQRITATARPLPALKAQDGDVYKRQRWGRKPTLILGFIVMAAGMGVLGSMMHIGIHSSTAQYIAVLMLLMFIVGFAMSAGPLIWVLCSEIQPLKGRDFGITCSTATNWIANMIVGATFLTMLNSLGSANTFWVYGGLNVLFILLTLWLIPETKNVSLEHIERNLMQGRPLREIGARD